MYVSVYVYMHIYVFLYVPKALKATDPDLLDR